MQNGKEVVFTGKFMIDGEHIVRDLLIEAAHEKGYVVGEKISWSTDLLVIGDTGHHGSTRKIKAATGFNVKIMTAKIFWQLI